MLTNYNVVIDLIGVVIVAIIFFGGRREAARDLSQRLFNGMLLLTGAILLFDISFWVINGSTAPYVRSVNILINLGYYVLQAPFCFLFLVYTGYWTGRTKEQLWRRMPLYHIPMAVALLLLLVNLWTGWVYSVDADNLYQRGVYFDFHSAIYYVYLGVALLIALRACFTAKDKVRRRRCGYIAGFMILPFIGTLLQLSIYGYGLSLIWPFAALSLLMVYINVQQEQIQAQRLSALRLENELTNNRIAIMLSQIQPHFLYNALCVVQDLCHGKAPEAEEATAHFSEFLRSNLDSINAAAPIPFSQELVHVQNYLYLEKLRFNERLNMTYDIQTTDFTLPTLTLQPLTENAVRYGVMSKVEGGTVAIASWEDESAFYISVTDDGVGFDTEAVKNDGRSHIGISNVRGRLQSMCGGELLIESTPGKGTCVKIKLPKEATA
ncbi:MAG: histidine kinase [Clostridia bacterium]|nr:histidine kinase [Clostridia bacterium]